jgi:pantoate--beta-alanine ligase
MRVVRKIAHMQRLSRRLAAAGKTIGLVPTMGYLHEGHLSLIRKVKRRADVVITSIFVNPTQFGPKDDLRRYPRDEKGDIRKIRSAGGEIVFIPSDEEMYPPDFQTWVRVDHLTNSLEGSVRPKHFRGVTTVVAKLFNICRPDVVAFGMKDFQQAIVLRRLTADLGYPLKYIIAPTVRERDGLAMSSRNAYFDTEGRREAICLYRALMTARFMVRAGLLQTRMIEREMRAVISGTAPSSKIDYIAFTDFDSLKPVKRAGRRIVCSLAVRIRGIRLIDNLKLL